MSGGAGKHEPDGGPRWPAQPPAQAHAEQTPSWMAGQGSAWDEPGWWRDQPEVSGSEPPRPARRRHRAGRSRTKLAVAGGIGVAGVLGLAAALVLTGVVGPRKPAPGFHPTATQPALAARQTADVFLAAWKSGNVRKTASYTDHSAAAAAALTSYRDGLNLRGLQVSVQSATARGIVAFSVHATVGLPANTAATAAWSYVSHLTAYEKHGRWWVRWTPALLAPNLTATERVISVPIAPGAAEVVDAAGNNLQDSSDPGLRNIGAALRTHAPAGLGTPGIEVALAGST